MAACLDSPSTHLWTQKLITFLLWRFPQDSDILRLGLRAILLCILFLCPTDAVNVLRSDAFPSSMPIQYLECLTCMMPFLRKLNLKMEGGCWDSIPCELQVNKEHTSAHCFWLRFIMKEHVFSFLRPSTLLECFQVNKKWFVYNLHI